MGRASFDSQKIPLRGPRRDVINEKIEIDGRVFRFCAVSMGNPHCVLICDEISEVETRRLGPLVEREPRFPNRTNVQFLKVLDEENLQIEIWERGAGYTLASGSSSCAAAAAAHRLGLCGDQVKVHMPGGVLEVSINPEEIVTLTGEAAPIFEGWFPI
jgi:diaminopimelate epimerase